MFLQKKSECKVTFWTILKKLFLIYNDLATFWATFGKLGNFLLQHVVTLQLPNARVFHCVLFLSHFQCDQVWRNFATSVKNLNFWQYFKVYLVFGKVLIPLWHNFYALGTF